MLLRRRRAMLLASCQRAAAAGRSSAHRSARRRRGWALSKGRGTRERLRVRESLLPRAARWCRPPRLPRPLPSHRREKGAPLLPPPWRKLKTHPSHPHLRPRRRVAVAPSPPSVRHPPQHTHPEKPPRPSPHVPPLPPLQPPPLPPPPLPPPPLPPPLPTVSLQRATPCGQVWPSEGRPLGSAVLPI